MNTFLSPVFAQNIENRALGNLGTLSATEFFGRLIPALMSLGIVVGVVVFLFNLIYGGILWISSGGDKGKIEQARSKIFNAIIGLIILLSFFAILNFFEIFFGIGLRSVYIGPFEIYLGN